MYLIVVAHPDDEIIGAGIYLSYQRDGLIIHTTDGAPRNLEDAQQHGFQAAQEYACARRAESIAALKLAGIDEGQIGCLGLPDQEASLNLESLTHSLRNILAHFNPDFVLTHPYEGGHPDHDATAFAVHQARPRRIIEMASYYDRGGRVVFSEFLPNGPSSERHQLTASERYRKLQMLACFKTQQDVLRHFPLDCEQFRNAPNYDFTSPPHEGELHYERHPWGMTGPRWRGLATQALAAL